MADSADNPARLVEHNPAWGPRAEQLLDELRAAFDGLAGATEAEFDHIGSTAVPALAAKPFLDLQVRLKPLPSDAELGPRLAPLGFERERGARPDSPGVDYDDYTQAKTVFFDEVQIEFTAWAQRKPRRP